MNAGLGFHIPVDDALAVQERQRRHYADHDLHPSELWKHLGKFLNKRETPSGFRVFRVQSPRAQRKATLKDSKRSSAQRVSPRASRAPRSPLEPNSMTSGSKHHIMGLWV